jgi:hypothetical protein
MFYGGRGMAGELRTLEQRNVAPRLPAEDAHRTLYRAARFLERAEADPVLLGALSERPLETAQAAGLDLWFLLKLVLELPEANDREILDVLSHRIQRAQRQELREPSCGNCGIEYCRADP